MGGNNINLPYSDADGGFTVVQTGNFVVLDAPECDIQVSTQDECTISQSRKERHV